MKKFQRTVEDFVCDHCGAEVRGTGFTNHCPQCLWGKHVDVNPGDRAAACGAMMEPIGAAAERGGYVLSHRCTTCGFVRTNKSAPEDSMDAIIELSKNPVW